MRSKTYKIKKNRYPGSLSGVLMFSIGLYVGIFLLTGWILSHRIKTQVGQFVPGQTYLGENFSRNLDLRVAAKNTYPSSALSVVKNLASAADINESIVSFKVPVDGLTEFGLMVRPSGKKPASGWPAIILCHGYANPSRYSTEINYLVDMEFYARHGFAVIKPDYRGQGFSLNAGTADSAYYSMAYNSDVMSLISSLKSTSFIDKNNINLWGHSMGSYIALRAAVLSPDIKNTILLAGPVDNLSKMYLEYIPPSDENNLNALKTRQAVFTKYGPPTENTNFWKNASPITFVSRIKAHLQIDVGSLDQTVPPQFSTDLDQTLNKKHIKHDYFVYDDGDHSLIAQRALIWIRSLDVMRTKSNSKSAAT